MVEEQTQLNFNPADKPIFADEVGMTVRLKASKDNKNVVHKEAMMGIFFIDMMKKQVLGEFVISKNTAKALSQILIQNIAGLEKELASKEMPKQPEIKTTTDAFSHIR